MITQYKDIQPYVTKDGSLIRELMHPDVHGNRQQSLAEAIVPVGFITFLHKHLKSEEIYHIVQGNGIVYLGDAVFEVSAQDTILIPPKIPHQIKNIGTIPLKILCCSSPAYSHNDTEIIQDMK